MHRGWCRRHGIGKNAGSRGVPQTWPGRAAYLEEEVCISYAQAALSASNSWSAADAAASLQQLQTASGEGLSVSSLGMHVLRAVAMRASPLGDLVREVLRTSFKLVKASSKSVRQRDLLPLPVHWNWALFAEFLKQSPDERRHRSSHRVRRLRRELHGVGCWSMLTICVLHFLYADVNHLMSCKSVGKKPRSAQLSALRRIVRDARWLLKMASPTPRCKIFRKFSNVNVWVT